jgi:hypothetical protein
MSNTQISAAELRSRQQELQDSLGDLEFEQFAVRMGCEPARARSLSRQIDATGNELTAVTDELDRLAKKSTRYSPPRLTRQYVDDAFSELIARF